MDLTTINEALGLASSAVGLTGKAASTLGAIKGLFDGGKPADSSEAAKLISELASELTTANVMNVQLSQALRTLNRELLVFNEFETEKSRYELVKTSQGAMVFKLKEEATNGQPVHFICPVCLNRDRIFSFISGNGDYRRCQTNNNHMFEFGSARQGRTIQVGDDYF